MCTINMYINQWYNYGFQTFVYHTYVTPLKKQKLLTFWNYLLNLLKLINAMFNRLC